MPRKCPVVIDERGGFVACGADETRILERLHAEIAQATAGLAFAQFFRYARSVRYFQRALSLDSTFMGQHRGFGDAYERVRLKMGGLPPLPRR